ncbi:MAG: polyphosphate polymerase domain-containing protein [Clostridia bacterium]
MKDTILTFKRFEKKYLLSARQFELLWERMRDHLVPDRFFRSTVCSIYYDSDDFALIRHSLEGPVYKEKLRLRSYNVPGPDDTVFVELKKKFRGVVYKRRVQLSAAEAEAYLAGRSRPDEDGQILREIDYFLQSHAVSPKVFIACDREAWDDRENPELRITFDRNLRWRDTDLSLCAGSEGEALLKDGEVLMEIKIPDAAPLWLAHLLSELEVFPTSFSKYGTCYRTALLEKYFNGVIVCV